MPGFDRSKFKPTPMAALKSQEEEHETKRPSGGPVTKAGYVNIEDGDNKIRIYPCHPDGGGTTYSEAKCVTFLSIEKQAYDDQGKPIEGKKVLKRFPVFNSKVHGNLPIDLVEEYLRIAKNKAIPAYTEDQKHRDNIWSYVTGMNGVKPGDTWAVYASKFENGVWGPVGILDLKKSIKTQLQDLAIEFVGNNPISPDPFTDPNEGIAVIITKSGKGLKTEYKVKFEKDGLGKNAQFVETPLTDEQLESFSKLDSLHKLYVKSFTRKDLIYQIEGLKNFEDELATKELEDKDGKKFTANIGVFQYEEFQNIMDRLLDLVPESTEVSEENEEEEGEEEVKEVIEIKKSSPKKPVEVKTPVKEEVKQESAVSTSAADRLQAIRDRLGKK